MHSAWSALISIIWNFCPVAMQRSPGGQSSIHNSKRWSYNSAARGRYEWQGVLIESEALERAEAECLEDAERRERQRERRRIRHAATNQCYLATFAERILELFPSCPPMEARAIAAHACLKHSGRVGRSAAAKQFDPQAIRLAVTAAIRHRFTDYDERLLAGCDRHQARLMVQPAVQRQLNQWSAAETGRGPDRLQC